MLVSLTAAVALVVSYFTTITVFERRGHAIPIRVAMAAAFGAFCWAAVVAFGRASGWVVTEEATFHHLYVLGVVGLPLAGLIMLANRRRAAPKRRWRITSALLLLGPGLLGVWATNIEPRWLRVDHHELESLAPHADEAIKIGVVADIQTDQFGQFERRVIDELNGQNPDIILVAGDILQTWPQDRERQRSGAIQALSKLEAPDGVYFVSGNNDTPDPQFDSCLLYTSPSPRDRTRSRMPSSA